MSQDWPFGDLLPLRYGVILSDPNWLFQAWSEAGEGKNATQHYDCMSLEEIQALPVHALAARDCACVMWGTAPMLPQAIETLRKWGFAYKSAGAWAKRSSRDRGWAFGTGYCYRSAAEFWLLGTIGEPEIMNHSTRNLIVAPRREHSRKPEQMYRDIEALFRGPYCEIFAAHSRKGWSSWGKTLDQPHRDHKPELLPAPTEPPGPLLGMMGRS